MKLDFKRKIAGVVASLIAVASLVGCSGFANDEGESVTNLNEITYGEGNISYEESTLGISASSPDITSLMVSGMYYVLHDGFYYPLVYDWINYDQGLGLGDRPAPENKLAVFDSTTITDIPTLFPGDRLFYYSTSGVYDYTTVERFKVIGWSIGLGNLKSNTTGHVYFEPGEDLESGNKDGVILSMEFAGIYDTVNDEEKASNGQFLLERIGGVEIKGDMLDHGVVVGLEQGKEYNVDIYTGTEYAYYPATSTAFYMHSFETYAIWEYTSLQDFLYEIKVPDYLLTGYYDFGGVGFIRILREPYYNKDTDYNERLLYPYYEIRESMNDEQLIEAEKDSWKKAGMYSENEILNNFEAFDETCFGWVDKEAEKEEGEEENNIAMEQFYEASTTKTSIWLPEGKACTISITTTETTGYAYLDYGGNNQRKIPYDRLLGGYVLEVTGTGVKAEIVVKGLYNDYKIKLVNAEQYNGQDGTTQPSVETESGGSQAPVPGEAEGEITEGEGEVDGDSE